MAVNTSPDQLLRKTLLWHGFPTAAKEINIPVRDIDAVLAEWKNYPACMSKYPSIVKGKS